jgi:hypothetical protein
MTNKDIWRGKPYICTGLLVNKSKIYGVLSLGHEGLGEELLRKNPVVTIKTFDILSWDLW